MKDHYEKSLGLRLNYKIIADFVEPNSIILDLGCGTGDLLKMLQDKKQVKGGGIEIDDQNVVTCLEKGLTVVQGNIDKGLKEYNDKSFDYVILNKTLQCTHRPDYVIEEMIRVGKKSVISFPNFAYWKVRLFLMFHGQMPKSNILPFEWYNTPNIHLLTISDFKNFCDKKNINIINEIYMNKGVVMNMNKKTANFFAEEAIFIIN